MDHFYNTATRMSKSSKILHQNNNYHNACYLGGYVVECYAKIIVKLFTMNSPRKTHDIINLNAQIVNILNTNNNLSRYILDGNIEFSNILVKWNPGSLRYIDTANELGSQALSDSFQYEIKNVMSKLAKLELDGYTLI